MSSLSQVVTNVPVNHMVTGPVDGLELPSVGLDFSVQDFMLLCFGLNADKINNWLQITQFTRSSNLPPYSSDDS